MGKHKFDQKKSVRFTLVPGPEKDGKPSVLFKPVETKKSKLSKKEKKNAISQLADVQQVTINGKVMEEDEIPAYVLDQIRGRGDLVYNQIHKNQEEQQVGDLYELQDAPGDEEYEQYEDYDFQAEGIKEEEKQEEDEWEDEEGEQYSDDQDIEIVEQDEEKPQQLKFKAKMQQFPALEEVLTVNIEGKQYKMTKKQLQMLDTIIPQNYEKMDFGGLNFKKYNQDGLLISDKEKYEKYLLKQNEKVVVVDTYEYIPSKPMDYIDNDLKPSQINSNANIREVQEALNYDGEQEIYQELQDDFFAKMIQGEQEENQEPKQVSKQQKKQKVPKEVKETKKEKISSEVVESKVSQKQLQEKLQKAMFNFQHNIEQKQDKKPLTDSQDSEDEHDSKNNHTTSLNFQQLEKKEEYIGKDGEMDWRFLTREEKKAYMKTKVIRQFEQELIEREVQEKMRGKTNVDVKDLHLKQRVDHIPFQQDHVMKKVLQQGLNQNLNDQQQESFESISDQDDIVSFHQKTSIIATNLSVIEEPQKKKKKEKKEEEHDEANNINIVKVIPEKRNRNQTSQQRKDRKNKLKEMKKEKREQKKQFAQRFNKIKKETMKKENPNNPLNKVSYVKIY